MSGARRRKGGCGILLVVAMVFGLSAPAQTTKKDSAREKLIGAWHLVHIDAPGPDGKLASVPQPNGMLIYTRDGHTSVQLMHPQSTNTLSNEYVLNGYEASFGVYDVDEATHKLMPLNEEAETQRAINVSNNFGHVASDLVQNTTDLLFREMWLRPALAPRDRSLVT